MATPFLGLRTAIDQVPDLQKAKEWYTKVFNKEPYFDEPFYVGFEIGGYELGLHPNETKNEDKATGVAAYWGVDDVQKEYDRLLSEGATENEKPTDVGGHIKVASVKDPWNNVIGIIYNPHFKV